MSQTTWEKRKREVLGQSKKTNSTPVPVVNTVTRAGNSAGSSGSAWSKRKQEVLQNATTALTQQTHKNNGQSFGISSRDDWHKLRRDRYRTVQDQHDQLTTLLATMSDYDIEDADRVKNELETRLARLESSDAYRNKTMKTKYAGKTSAQLSTLAKQATDPSEKAWLESAAQATMTDDDYKFRIARNTDEKRHLEAMFAEVPDTGTFLKSVYTTTPVAAGTKQGKTKDALAKEYGYSSWREAQNRYDAIERELYFDTNTRKYSAIQNAEDYQEKSRYDATKGVGVEAGEHAQYNRLNQMDMEGAKVGPALLRDKYDYMTEEDRATYNYIYNTEGKDAAEEYLDFMSYRYNEERQRGIQMDSAYFTDTGVGKVVSSGVSVPLRLASGIALVDVAGQKIRNAITGEDRPVDFNTGLWSSRSVSAGLRSGMAQNFNEMSGTIQLDEEKYPVLSKALNGIGAGDMYSLGMSMADSGVVAALSPIIGPGGVALLASSAGADGVQAALENGATENQAIWMGTINGAAEALFEYISLDNLLKGNPTTVLKSAFKQGGIEASEEAATSIANLLGDYVIMAKDSAWEKDIALYMNGGDDVKTATWKAFWGKVADVAMDAVGGFLSGSVMGGGTTAVQNAQAQTQYGNQVDAVLENAIQYGVDSKATQKAQSNMDAGKRVSSSTIRTVMEQTEQAKANQAMQYVEEAAKILVEYGQEVDVTETAQAISKALAGQELTSDELATIERSDVAPIVFAEMQIQKASESNAVQTTDAEQTAQEAASVSTTEHQEAKIPSPVEVEENLQKIAPVAEIGQESATVEDSSDDIPMSVAEDEAAELKARAKEYGEEAEAYLESFDAGQNVVEYDVAWRAGYELGLSQVPQAQAMESKDIRYLTPGQRVDAYEAGLRAAGAEATKQEARVLSTLTRKDGTRREGIIRAYPGVTLADLQSQFNDTQKKAYKVLSDIARATGIDIVLWKSDPARPENYQGKYLRSEPGRIYLDVNAGISKASDLQDAENFIMLATFTHEFVHYMENWNPIRYYELRKAVFDAMESKGVNVVDRIDTMMAESKDEITREGASREVVAESLSEILPDANFVEDLATKHKTLFRQLLDRLKEFLEDIKSYFAGMRKSNDPGVEALQENRDGVVRYLENIVKLFDNVAVEAVERMQESDMADGATDTTAQKQRRSVEEQSFVNEIDAWNRGELPTNTDFVLDSTGEVLQGLGAIESDIYINGSKIKKIMREHPEMTLEEIKKIPQILRNPTLILKSGNDVGKTADNTRILLFGTVKATNGQPVMTGLDLRPIEKKLVIEGMQKVSSAYTKTNSPIRFIQNSQVVYADKNKTTKLLRTIGFQLPIPLQSGGYVGSITYDDGLVKVQGVPFSDFVLESNGAQFQRRKAPADRDAEYMDAVNRGDMETAQRIVDEAAKQAGYGGPFYHGAKNGGGFTKFRDWSYFTQNKKYAERYTDRNKPESMYTVYVQMNNPFDTRKAKAKREFQNIREEYGLSAIQASGLPDWTDGYDISEYIDENDLGYDGILLDEGGDMVDGKPVSRGISYVVRKSNQVKSAAPVTYDDEGNVIPLSKRFKADNPDIRYQRRSGTTFVSREAMQEYRHKRHESELKKRYKMRIRKTIMDLDKLLNRGTKQANVKEEMRELVSGTLRAADMLFLDEYTAADMIRSGIGVEITDKEAAHLEKAQDILAQMEAIAGSTQESMQKRDALKKQLDAQTAQMRDVFQRERKRIYGAKVADVLNQLSNLYSGLSDSEAGFIQAAYDENVAEYLRNLHKLIGGVTVRDMSAEQMENLSNAFTMILTKVRTANKAFAENIRESIETMANDTIAQEEGQKTRKKGRIPALDTAEALWFNNEKPIYAFERIGSKTLSKLYENVANGENTFAEDINEAKNFKEDVAKKYRMTEWDFNTTKKFRSSSGLEFELNLGHIMSLYAYAKRPAAHDHITKGGIVFPPSTKVRKKVGPFQFTVRLKDATAYNISDDLLMEILTDENLSQEQKAFVDEMQDYLSSVMGDKGNEVSLAMYGIRQFGEKNYFPIRSSGTYMAKAEESELKKQAGQATLASAGFTKATVPKASNPIVLDEFMTVWANHVNDMSLYHSFVLPLADFQRVYNYNTPHREGGQSKSVKAAISNAHGDAATSYIRQLISDVNGGVMADPRESMTKKLVSGFKKASVVASASVIVQQPSAMYRAQAMIDRKYFGPLPVVGDVVSFARGVGRAILAHKRHTKLWEQAKKYAPGVVTIKEIGGFDTATGQGITDYLSNTERQGAWNKVKAFAGDSKYRSAGWDNILGYLPAAADELSWVEIWLACKRETMAKHPGMKWDSQGLLELSGKRFTEVIRKTQVYDSIFAKSSYMRSKSSAVAMMTSFMAEPTTTINMTEEMLSDLAHGNVKKAGRIAVSVIKSMVINNLLKALVYAGWDDDEDETWAEKYVNAIASGLVNDVNPLNYYPYLRDVNSLLSGYEVERADTTFVSKIADGMKKIYTLHNKDTSGMDEEALAKHSKAEIEAGWDLVAVVVSCFGIPANNIKREISGVFNFIQTVGRDAKERDTSEASFWNAVWEGVNESLPFFWQKDTGDKRAKLYNAVVAGDEAYRKRMEGGYKDEDAYHAALREAMRENDPRIKEAAQARYDGDIAKYTEIAKAILGEKHFTQNDIIAAIDSEVALLEPDGEKGGSKAKGLYKGSDFAAIARDGEWELADTIIDDMIATYELQGKSPRQAKTACATAIKSALKEDSMAGNISEENAIHALTLAADMDKEEAQSQYDDWMTELQYGVSNGEVKSAYMDGKITKETAIEIRMAYTGDSREKVSKTIRDWDAEKATGYVYSDIEKEFLKGNITSGEAIKMYKTYGESDADAREKVTKLEFQKRWPGSDGITAEAVEKYQAFCVNAGVPGTSYYQAWKFSANTTADVGKDGKAISGSKKKKVLNYVNTLPLTSKQKDAIYYAFGWAKSTISEAPWH